MSVLSPEETVLLRRQTPPNDPVDHPAHYTAGPVEVIDIIGYAIDAAGTDGKQAWLLGTVLKYLCRYPHKGKPAEDLKKARWYLDRLIGEAKR